MKNYDFLIVGSGLYGATFAYMARKMGKRCLVIEKRNHLGGNLYCETREGIHVHKYGAHIFHTSDEVVWRFVNSLVKFNHFINMPVAISKGKLFNLPFNMNTFHQIWGISSPREAQSIIEEQSKKEKTRLFLSGVKKARNLEEQALMMVGRDIYQTLIKEYTEKRWGRRCTELPAFIIKRLPLRFTFDNNYYNDTFQGVPEGGYNVLIEALLQGIETRTNIDFFSDRRYWESQASRIVYTGRLDEFFDFRFGKLEYRTLRFEEHVFETPNFQGNAVVNYIDASVPYTRSIEHKHLELFGDEIYGSPKTVVTIEYPMEWGSGMEPFYPVNNDSNNALAERYKMLAESFPHVLFGGRLAEYGYYDMAAIIKHVFEIMPIAI